MDGPRADGDQQGPRRALEDVVCYKVWIFIRFRMLVIDILYFQCGYKGHYANKCNKGHLAFLSHKAGANNRDAMQRN